MAISARLRAFLRSSKAKHTEGRHPVVYTAQEIAAAQHVPGRQLAKCVLVKTDRGPFLAVLPAIHLIDLKQLKGVLGVKSLSIAKEADIKAQFPDVEVGAMSPFGGLYGVPVVVDRTWSDGEDIVFNAGTHTSTIKMRYGEFVRLAKPLTGAFGRHISSSARRPRRSASAHRTNATAARRRSASRSRRA